MYLNLGIICYMPQVKRLILHQIYPMLKSFCCSIIGIFLLLISYQSKALITNPGFYAPNDGDTIMSHAISMVANNGTGIDSFRYQVDTVNTFNSPYLSNTKSKYRYGNSANRYTFNTKVFIRLKVYSATDSSDWSVPLTLYIYKKPNLALPADNFVGNMTGVSWANTSSNAYELMLDTSITFNSDAAFKQTYTQLSYTKVNLDSIHFNKKYYWKVRNIFGSDTSEWSNIRSFIHQPDFDLLYPTIGKNYMSSTSQLVIVWKTKSMGFVEVDVNNKSDFTGKSRKAIFDASVSDRNTINQLDFIDQQYVRVRFLNKVDTLDWIIGGTWRTNVPRITDPYTGAVLTLRNERLSFLGGDGVDTIHYQIAYDSNFDSLMADSEMITTSVVLGTLELNTTYYARTRLLHQKDTSVWSGTYQWSTIKPGDNSYIMPRWGQDGIDPSFRFSYSSNFDGADTMIIRLDTVADFSSPYLKYVGWNYNNNAINPEYLNFGTMHYYSYKLIHQGVESEWSTADSFITWKGDDMTYVYPPNKAKNWNVQNNLEVKKEYLKKGYEYYYWQLDTVPTFDSKVLLEDTSVNYKSIPIKSKHYLGQDYFWRVAYVHRNDTSMFSDTWTFQSHITYLNLPKNNSKDLNNSVLLEWSTSFPGLTGFILQIDTTMDFNAKSIGIIGGDNNKYQVTNLLNAEDYYWRVKPFHELDTGIWSDVYTFSTKKLAALTKPKLISPANNSKNLEAGNQTFRWSATFVENSTYELQLATDQDFNNTLYSGKNTNTIVAISGFIEGRQYFWRVRMVRGTENGPWSAVYNFTTKEKSNSIADLAEIGILIYPNPTSDYIQIESEEPIQARLINIQGKELLNSTITKSSKISLVTYPSGIYNLVIIKQGSVYTTTIIKR